MSLFKSFLLKISEWNKWNVTATQSGDDEIQLFSWKKYTK